MSRQTDLRSFAEYWLRRPLTAGDALVVPSSVKLPTALREIYETFGGCAQLTSPFNSLLPPEDIQTHDEYSIFYEENQRVAVWAFRTADREADDPIVYQGSESLENLFWTSEERPISEWIKGMTLWQLVNGGYAHCAYAHEVANIEETVSALYPEVFNCHDGNIRRRFFGAEGCLICLAGNDSLPSAVFAAAANHTSHRTLINRLGLEHYYILIDS